MDYNRKISGIIALEQSLLGEKMVDLLKKIKTRNKTIYIEIVTVTEETLKPINCIQCGKKHDGPYNYNNIYNMYTFKCIFCNTITNETNFNYSTQCDDLNFEINDDCEESEISSKDYGLVYEEIRKFNIGKAILHIKNNILHVVLEIETLYDIVDIENPKLSSYDITVYLYNNKNERNSKYNQLINYKQHKHNTLK